MRIRQLLIFALLAIGIPTPSGARPLVATDATLAIPQQFPLESVRLAARVAFGADDAATAMPWIAQWLRLDPDDGRGWLMRAWANSAAGNLTAALGDYAMAVERNPDQPARVWAGIAAANVALGRHGVAVQALQRAVIIARGDAGLQRSLCVGLLAVGRSDDALDAADFALRLAPRYAEAHACRARALRELGRADEELDALLAALAGESRDGDVDRAALWQSVAEIAASLARATVFEQALERLDATAPRRAHHLRHRYLSGN